MNRVKLLSNYSIVITGIARRTRRGSELSMEQDRVVSPPTLATNYTITGTFITAWSVNEQNGVRKKSLAKKGLPRKP